IELTELAWAILAAIGHEEKDGILTESGLPQVCDQTNVRAQASEIYRLLLKGTETHWLKGGTAGADRLIIVPHGILHAIPFGTLYDGSRYLVEHLPISQLPSSSVLPYLAVREGPAEPVTYFGF